MLLLLFQDTDLEFLNGKYRIFFETDFAHE